MVIIICCVLSLVPSTYIHPFRVRTFMALSIAVTLVWVVSAAWLTWAVIGQGQSGGINLRGP